MGPPIFQQSEAGVKVKRAVRDKWLIQRTNERPPIRYNSVYARIKTLRLLVNILTI